MKCLDVWSPHNRLVALMFVTQILGVFGVIYFWDPAWLLLTAGGVFMFVSLGTECYMHRYLSHQSFKMRGWVKCLLHILSIFALQGPALMWAANHVTHHRHSDRDGDPHPSSAGWRSWFWVGTNTNATVSIGTVKRLLKDPMCVWTRENYFKVYCGVTLVAALIDPRVAVYLFFLPAMWSFHAAGFVTVCLHRYGYRNFDTPDSSRNLSIAALFLGAHLHNNHHANPGRYNDAIRKGEIDLHGLLIHYVLKRL